MTGQLSIVAGVYNRGMECATAVGVHDLCQFTISHVIQLVVKGHELIQLLLHSTEQDTLYLHRSYTH